MEKKRSKGVTFWGCLFIVYGAIGLSGVTDAQPQIKTYGIAMFVLGLALSAATLGCGIFILKLNETARKIAILVCILSVLLSPAYVRPMLSQATLNEFYAKKKQAILEEMKPQYQQKALEDLEKVRGLSKNGVQAFFIIFLVVLLTLDLLPVYFFTRPGVMEQFR